MESSESRINQIITQHDHLMLRYQNILDEFEGKKTMDSRKFIVENPKPYFKNKNIGPIEKFNLIGNYIFFLIRNESVNYYFKSIASTVFKKRNLQLSHNESVKYYLKSIISTIFKKRKFQTLREIPEKERFLTPLVKYMIKTHIRRQLNNLHRLYLREIFIQKKYSNKEEIQELLRTNAILHDYVRHLPDIRRFLVTLTGLVLAIISVAPIIGINSILSNVMKGNFDILLGIILGSVVGGSFVLADIFSSAFRIKRSIFMHDTSSYPFYDLYFGKGKEIYEKSIYKIENDLYEKLGKDTKKPKEIPIDCLLQSLLPGGFIVFLTSLMVSGLVFFLIEKKGLPAHYEVVISFLSLFTFVLFIMPFVKYRRRRKNGLL